MRDRSSSTDSPRIAGQQEEAAGPLVRRTLSIETRNQPPLSPRAASGGDGSPSTSPHLLKEKVAQLQARRSSYGPSHPPPKWEGLEGVKLEDRIKGLSASFSPLFSQPSNAVEEAGTGRPRRLDPSKLSAIATVLPQGSDSPSGGLSHIGRLPTGAPPIRFLGFGPDAHSNPEDAAGAAAELLKNSVLLTIDVPALGTSVKLRFRVTSSVDAAKQVLHRKLLKDELLAMNFWNPATGTSLRPDRNLQDYLVQNEDRLVLATEHSSSAVQTKVRVEVEPTRLVETVLCYKETTVLGLIQTMNRKGIPLEHVSLYGLWRGKDCLWLDETKLVSSYGLEQSETLVLKRRFAEPAVETPPTPPSHASDQLSQAQQDAADTIRKRFRTTSTTSFVRVKNSQVNVDQSGEPPFDPSGAIIVVKFLCKNSDFITMLRVGTRDSTDTLRARIKKKLDDVHNYDIYLPSLVRMAEDTCLEDHHVKERDQLELRKKPDPAGTSPAAETLAVPEVRKEDATQSRPTKKKSEGGSSIRVFGSMRRKKERALTASAPPFPMTAASATAAAAAATSPPPAPAPAPVPATAPIVPPKDDDGDKRRSKIWGRERDLLTSFFKNRPDKDELVAKKILVHPDGSVVLEEAVITLNADVVSRTIEWLRQQRDFFELEGVFRISGASTAVKQIWSSFRGPAEEIDFKQAGSPHDVCGALKHYFRESPVPLIPFEHHQDFVAAGQLADDRQCADALKAAVPALPAENMRMVKELFGFLHQVMLHQEKNKMSANNLGIVFGPSIMRNRSNTVDFSSTGHQSAATYSMIQYYDYIFANAEWKVKAPPTVQPSPRHLPVTPLPPVQPASPVVSSLAKSTSDAQRKERGNSMSDEHRALLAHISLFDKTDDFALLGLAKKLHAADTDTKLAEVMEKELNGPKLVALCLGFARVISDMTEKRQHDAAGSKRRSLGESKLAELLANLTSSSGSSSSPTSASAEEGLHAAAGKPATEAASAKKTSKRKSKKKTKQADGDVEEVSKRRSGSWLAIPGKSGKKDKGSKKRGDDSGGEGVHE